MMEVLEEVADGQRLLGGPVLQYVSIKMRHRIVEISVVTQPPARRLSQRLGG